MQRTSQDQRLDFVQRPDHRFDGVPAELLEGRNALVTINDQITIRLIGDRNDDDGSLLSATGQRGQQLPLPLGMAHPQVFMAAVQLVKLQLHAFSSPAQTLPQSRSGIAPRKGEVCRKVSRNQ
jgi:hypothetical protein